MPWAATGPRNHRSSGSNSGSLSPSGFVPVACREPRGAGLRRRATSFSAQAPAAAAASPSGARAAHTPCLLSARPASAELRRSGATATATAAAVAVERGSWLARNRPPWTTVGGTGRLEINHRTGYGHGSDKGVVNNECLSSSCTKGCRPSTTEGPFLAVILRSCLWPYGLGTI